MPKLPIDYSKTIIYRIVCKDPTIRECYVGSTTNFKNRKRTHKSNCNIQTKDYNMNVYQFIRANGGWYNFDMIEIEKYNAIDKLSQSKRERYWLEFYQSTLNMRIPSQTQNDWTEINREHILEYRKNYYDKNKEEILEHNKIYRENNRENAKEYAKEYYNEHKEQKCEYSKNDYKNNFEKYAKKSKKYYNENKEKLLTIQKQKYTCECGSTLNIGSKSTHIKTKKHLALTCNAINVSDSLRNISSIGDKLEPE
jgi:hypothetical protein